MKKILISAYYFPPFAGVGGIRAAKFAKFLPQNGWYPNLLTVDEKYYGQNIINNDFLGFESKYIYRLPYFTFLNVGKAVKLFFPLIIIWHVIKHRKELDMILLCASPFYPFIIAPILRLVFKIPVILDFRDGWSVHGRINAEKPAGRLINIFRMAIELIGIKSSSACLFSTPVLKDLYRSKYSIKTEICHTIYNGFDPDDFVNVQPIKLTDDKTLFMAGKFYFYTPDIVNYIFRYLQESNKVKLIYMGNERKILNGLAEKYGIQDKLILFDYKPYSEVLEICSGADLCLVTTKFSEGLGTKIFDYIALKKNILCFVPNDSQIKETFENVLNIYIQESPHSYESVKEAINSYIIADNIHLRKINKYSRVESVRKLSKILNTITKVKLT